MLPFDLQSVFSFFIFVTIWIIGHMFMEHWRQTSIPSAREEEEGIPQSDGILTATSGNTQSYALESKEGLENQNPVINSAVLPTTLKPVPSQHAPGPTLISDAQQASLQRLHARKQRRVHGYRHTAEPPRPYLECKAYLDYRDRQRKDTGIDGKVVWDNVVEAAFQDGG